MRLSYDEYQTIMNNNIQDLKIKDRSYLVKVNIFGRIWRYLTGFKNAPLEPIAERIANYALNSNQLTNSQKANIVGKLNEFIADAKHGDYPLSFASLKSVENKIIEINKEIYLSNLQNIENIDKTLEHRRLRDKKEN